MLKLIMVPLHLLLGVAQLFRLGVAEPVPKDQLLAHIPHEQANLLRRDHEDPPRAHRLVRVEDEQAAALDRLVFLVEQPLNDRVGNRTVEEFADERRRRQVTAAAAAGAAIEEAWPEEGATGLEEAAEGSSEKRPQGADGRRERGREEHAQGEEVEASHVKRACARVDPVHRRPRHDEHGDGAENAEDDLLDVHADQKIGQAHERVAHPHGEQNDEAPRLCLRVEAKRRKENGLHELARRVPGKGFTGVRVERGR